MKSPQTTEAIRALLSRAAMSLLLMLSTSAHAGLIAYTDQAAFNLAIAGWSATTTDFESEAGGTMYGVGSGPAGSGFTLALSGPDAPAMTPAMTPTVGDLFWTTSGTHYLGLDNPDTAFEAGDELTFTFASGMRGFGLYVIGTQDIGAGDITLTTSTGSVANAAVANLSDGQGSYAFFLGLVSDDATTFSSITLHNLTLLDPRLLNIAIDDVTLARQRDDNQVPEPGALLLCLTGLLIAARTRRQG